MAPKFPLQSKEHRLAVTELGQRVRRTPQPATGWSLAMVERDARAVFDALWCAGMLTAMECIDVGVKHFGEEASRIFGANGKAAGAAGDG